MTRIGLEYHGHIAYITFDHAPANTWTLASLNAFLKMMAELNGRPDVMALVIRGAGEIFFSAGIEPKIFADGHIEHAVEVTEAVGKVFEALARFHGVSIAAINGAALGGGLEIALACDIRIAEEQALLGLPEASVGLLPYVGGILRLSELVGSGWAKRIILCGEKVDATLASRIGLVEEVVNTGQAWEAARQLAQRVEHQSPSVLQACKRLINHGHSHLVEKSVVEESVVEEKQAQSHTSLLDRLAEANQREGMTAFLEKRAPRWHYGSK
ncbi:MAG: enoyl-CoA hydratase [Aeromonas sp.]